MNVFKRIQVIKRAFKKKVGFYKKSDSLEELQPWREQELFGAEGISSEGRSTIKKIARIY